MITERTTRLLPSMTAPAAPQHVLVVGGGGRENALAWALARSAGVKQVWVAPGNGGTAELEGCIQLAISEGDQDALLKTCQDERIDLVVVGPEAPWPRASAIACARLALRSSALERTAPCWRPVNSGPRR